MFIADYRFSSANVIGHYELDLANPFERAVAILQLDIVASHSTYKYTQFDYDPTFVSNHEGSYSSTTKPPSPMSSSSPPPLHSSKIVKIDLHAEVTTLKMQYFTDRQKQLADNLRSMVVAASDIQQAVKLFNEVDTDNSGTIEALEFAKLLEALGLDSSPDSVAETMNEYDVDMSKSYITSLRYTN